jgi:transcriptional regulator with XRE-family HTH domain
MTLKELAVVLGFTSHGYISEIESGRKKPTADFVLAVAQHFHVTTDELLRDEIHLQTLKSGIEARMSTPFISRPPTPGEFEKLRLLLSVYQDGTGQYGDAPGWRDFERLVALFLDGTAVENKAIFDIEVPDENRPNVKCGIACKMRRELSYLERRGRLTLELSNSNQKFWNELEANGINRTRFRERPTDVGRLIVGLIEKWQDAVSLRQGGDIDLSLSSYLVLTYDGRRGIYVIHWLPLALPDPMTLDWSFPSDKRLLGTDPTSGDKIFEWFYDSGAQLKYFPHSATARWASPKFMLEPLPADARSNTVLTRAQVYFPQQWAAAEEHG